MKRIKYPPTALPNQCVSGEGGSLAGGLGSIREQGGNPCTVGSLCLWADSKQGREVKRKLKVMRTNNSLDGFRQKNPKEVWRGTG